MVERRAGAARWFEGRFEEHGVPHWPRNYDVTPEGDRFLMVGGSEEPPSARIEVVLNWLTELTSGARHER